MSNHLPKAPEGRHPFFLAAFFAYPVLRNEEETFWWVQCVGCEKVEQIQSRDALPDGWRVVQALHPETEAPVGPEYYVDANGDCEQRAMKHVCGESKTPKVSVTMNVRVPRPAEVIDLPIPVEQKEK